MGTAVMRLIVIKTDRETEETSVSIYEQIHYEMENFDKLTKVIISTQADKMYRNLVSYMNELFNQKDQSVNSN